MRISVHRIPFSVRVALATALMRLPDRFAGLWMMLFGIDSRPLSAAEIRRGQQIAKELGLVD